jgi:hypothetical protein
MQRPAPKPGWLPGLPTLRGSDRKVAGSQTQAFVCVVCSAGAVLQVPHSDRRRIVDAPLAQSAERLHGKEKVYGSIP